MMMLNDEDGTGNNTNTTNYKEEAAFATQQQHQHQEQEIQEQQEEIQEEDIQDVEQELEPQETITPQDDGVHDVDVDRYYNRNHRLVLWSSLSFCTMVVWVSILLDLITSTLYGGKALYTFYATLIICIVSVISTVLCYSLPVTTVMSTFIEGCLAFFVFILTVPAVSVIMNPKNEIAVLPYRGGAVREPNIYFFTWFTLCLSLCLLSNVICERYPNNLYTKSIRITDGRCYTLMMRYWLLLAILSLIVGTSSYQSLDYTGCTDDGDDADDTADVDASVTGGGDGNGTDTEAGSQLCTRTRFALSLGIISYGISFWWIFFRYYKISQSKERSDNNNNNNDTITATNDKKVFKIIDTMISLVLFIGWCFGAGFITLNSTNSPAYFFSTLYFCTWGCLFTSLMLTLHSTNQMKEYWNVTRTTSTTTTTRSNWRRRNSCWILMSITSMITFVAIHENYMEEDLVGEAKKKTNWSFATMVIVSALSTCGSIVHIFLIEQHATRKLVEGGLACIVFGMTVAVLPTIMKYFFEPNIYFFSWATLILSLHVLIDFILDVRPNLFPTNTTSTSMTPTFVGPVYWLVLAVTSLITMVSSSRRFDLARCGDYEIYEEVICNRITFAISLGAISGFASATWMLIRVFLSQQGKDNVVIFVESTLSLLLLVCWCFGVGYITSPNDSPGSYIGNLYFSSWGSLFVSIILTISGVRRMKEHMTTKSNGTSTNANANISNDNNEQVENSPTNDNINNSIDNKQHPEHYEDTANIDERIEETET